MYQSEHERQEAAFQNKYVSISDGLRHFLTREGLQQSDLCKTLALHHSSARKLLDAEPVALDMVKLIKLVYLAGYQIVPVKKEDKK